MCGALRAALSIMLAWTLSMGPAARAGDPLAVLFPVVREPYSGIFQEIMRGIEDQQTPPTERIELERDFTSGEIGARLRSQGVHSLITLGNRGFRAAGELVDEVPRIVIGAVLVRPQDPQPGLTGISLAPDPKILLQRLRELVPQVQRVTVVYSQEYSGWLVAMAREAAEALDITLEAHPVADIKQAAAQYRDAFECRDNLTCALWILQDPATLDDKAILPLILKKAWDNRLVVFSSSPGHVRRGALFSLYPDNYGLGQSLAALARRPVQERPGGSEIEPLRDLRIAVNLRTAEHLGLHLSARKRRDFDMVFPSR